MILRCEGLTQAFEGAGEVLRGARLEVDAGEAVAVVGPSGSGKSTLLHLCAGLIPLQGGEIDVAGQSLRGLDRDGLSDLRNRELGLVFQRHHLLPQLGALDNVLVPALGRGAKGPATAEPRARSLLEAVGLAERLHHRPGQLSGGECQRVAVARALVNAPRLLLADEPTGALDRHNADSLAELLLSLREREGTALLVVTHDTQLAGRMDRALRLDDGVLHEA